MTPSLTIEPQASAISWMPETGTASSTAPTIFTSAMAPL